MENSGIEDIYTFYREDIDSNFAIVWSQLLENTNYCDSCDVRIDCFDGYYIHSHKSLLSISSKCFRRAFQFYSNHFAEELPLNEELVITLPQFISSQELESIINYIYIGFVSIPESRVNQFLDVSKFLEIKGLEDIILIFEDEIDGWDQVMTSSQFTRIQEKPKFEIESKKCNHRKHLIEKSRNKSLTSLKWFPKEALISRTANSVKKKYSSMASTLKRVGRRPQVGSPFITEDFKTGDRYECKVCLKTYLWKKSLVRHYRDLHPQDVQLVA